MNIQKMTRHEKDMQGYEDNSGVMKGQCTEIEATQGGHDAAMQTERERESERERERDRKRERNKTKRERGRERERERESETAREA